MATRTRRKKTTTRRRQPKTMNGPGPEDIEWAESTVITPAEARAMTGTNKTCECICTICTCGTHRCPPDRVQGKYDNLKTSYMDSYRGDMVPVERVARRQYVHKTRPFEGITTAQSDYKWDGLPVKRELATAARMDNGIGTTNLPFEGTTTHKSDFQKWNVRPSASARGPQQRLSNMPDDRDFSTEFRGKYDPKPLSMRTSKAPQERQNQSLPFEGTTTHQSDFQKWDARPPRSFYRSAGYRARPDDRDFLSENRGEFTEKEFDVCPAKQVAVSTKPQNGHVCVERTANGYCLCGTNSWE